MAAQAPTSGDQHSPRRNMAVIDDIIGARLLRHARAAIGAELQGDVPTIDPDPWPPLGRAGVFVTLRKHGNLRGCIGTFTEGELLETIAEIAVASTRDPRFVTMPLSARELSELRIELSVLSPRERIANPLDFELGVHGIYVKRGFNTGCFLPDVGAEFGWDREQFLAELCSQKAGLHAAAWREPETEIHRFVVQKFVEAP